MLQTMNHNADKRQEQKPSVLDDELMTVSEIAQILKLNQQTIRNWIDAGKLPHLRLGRRVRIWRSDFEAFINDAARDYRSPEPNRTIWDGVIELPEVPDA